MEDLYYKLEVLRGQAFFFLFSTVLILPKCIACSDTQ